MTKDPKKTSGETEPEGETKKSFWATPAGLTALAALITAVLSGLAAVVAALAPILLATPVPSTVTPGAIVVIATPTNENFCASFYDENDLPVYPVPVGIPQNIPARRALTEPFALKFMENAQNIGGMKLSLNADGTFKIYQVADENCFNAGSSGRSTSLQAGLANEFQYMNAIYVLVLNAGQDILKVEIKRK